MRLKNNKKIILFDFDGVIVDSFRIAYESQRSVIPGLTEDEHRKCFEGNIFEELKKMNRKQNPDSDKFFEIYLPKLFQLQPIKNIPEILKSLARKYRLIVVSSTISSPINEWLSEHNLTQYFTEIMGADVHKSKVEKIKMVFKKYKTNTGNCVFITDTLGDILEARKANLNSLAVTYGFHGEDTLKRGNPAGFIKTPQDIPAKIEKYFKEI